MEHRIALVTGASSGIGEALCYRLAQEGIRLIICGRNESRLNELREDLPSGSVLKIVVSDLKFLEGRDLIIAAIHEYAPDLVVNNAGYGAYGNALTYTTRDQAAILEVNGNAVLEITLEAARVLKTKRQQGVIVNISSAASFMICPNLAVYSATKAFVTSLSQSLNIEFEPFGIHVLANCPGVVLTDFANRAGTIDENAKFQPLSMNTKSVVEEIWEQIQRLEPVRVVDWKYRILLVLAGILPKRWVALELQKNLQKRAGPRKFIDSEQ